MTYSLNVCPTIYYADEHCNGRTIEDNLRKLVKTMRCRDEDLDRLEEILKSDIIINRTCNSWHISRLTHGTVLCSDEVVLWRLLQEGTLLKAAIRSQCVLMVQKVLEMLPNINEETNRNYFEALHIAASRPNSFITTYLLDYGANVNSIDGYGRTPLFYAVKYNQLEQCKWLLWYGADDSSTGTSNLYHAMFPRTEEFNYKIIRLLLKEGLDPNTTGNDEGKTILHGVADNAQLRNSIKFAQVLLKYGADINAITEKGDSVLHLAANKCISVTLLVHLIDSKVDLNVRNAKNETFLDILRQRDDLNTRQNIIVDLMRYLLLEQARRNFKYDFEKMKMTDKEGIEYKLCKEELDKLKKIELNNHVPFTLYHILIWTESRIAKLRVDPGLDTDETSQFETRYPKYGAQLRINYVTGLRRLKAENAAIELFESILGERVGNDIIRELVEYFSTEDLEIWIPNEK